MSNDCLLNDSVSLENKELIVLARVSNEVVCECGKEEGLVCPICGNSKTISYYTKEAEDV